MPRLYHSPECPDGGPCGLCEARIDAREFDRDFGDDGDIFGWAADEAAEREAEGAWRWVG